MQICQSVAMIFGAHFVLSSENAEADRSFLAEVFGFDSVDAGGGWLIFGLPPAEVGAVHPAEAPGGALYLICDNLSAEMKVLTERGVSFSDVEEARWADHHDSATRRRRGGFISAQASAGAQTGGLRARRRAASCPISASGRVCISGSVDEVTSRSAIPNHLYAPPAAALFLSARYSGRRYVSARGSRS